jgi:hypothetical protein
MVLGNEEIFCLHETTQRSIVATPNPSHARILPVSLVAAPFLLSVGEAGLGEVPEPLGLVDWPPGLLTPSLDNLLSSRPCTSAPLVPKTCCFGLVVDTSTSLPFFGFLMPLSMRDWQPGQTAGIEKFLLNCSADMRPDAHCGGLLLVDGFVDSRSVLSRLLYCFWRLSKS